jgi:methylenetetrahydrofolate--tRNA-(uracil-5-)-methyltransferase
MLKEINVIGAGLAGSEAAFQLATRGYKINLFDGKAKRKKWYSKDWFLRGIGLFQHIS